MHPSMGGAEVGRLEGYSGQEQHKIPTSLPQLDATGSQLQNISPSANQKLGESEETTACLATTQKTITNWPNPSGCCASRAAIGWRKASKQGQQAWTLYKMRTSKQRHVNGLNKENTH